MELIKISLPCKREYGLLSDVYKWKWEPSAARSFLIRLTYWGRGRFAPPIRPLGIELRGKNERGTPDETKPMVSIFMTLGQLLAYRVRSMTSSDHIAIP